MHWKQSVYFEEDVNLWASDAEVSLLAYIEQVGDKYHAVAPGVPEGMLFDSQQQAQQYVEVVLRIGASNDDHSDVD